MWALINRGGDLSKGNLDTDTDTQRGKMMPEIAIYKSGNA